MERVENKDIEKWYCDYFLSQKNVTIFKEFPIWLFKLCFFISKQTKLAIDTVTCFLSVSKMHILVILK